MKGWSVCSIHLFPLSTRLSGEKQNKFGLYKFSITMREANEIGLTHMYIDMTQALIISCRTKLHDGNAIIALRLTMTSDHCLSVDHITVRFWKHISLSIVFDRQGSTATLSKFKIGSELTVPKLGADVGRRGIIWYGHKHSKGIRIRDGDNNDYDHDERLHDNTDDHNRYDTYMLRRRQPCHQPLADTQKHSLLSSPPPQTTYMHISMPYILLW